MSIAVLLLFGACENDVAQVQRISSEKRIPMEIQENLRVVYTDSTRPQMIMTAPRAESYPSLKEPQREFPQGIEVEFLDNTGKPESHLKADYALQLLNKNVWEARGNVVVVNEENEKLQTEKLFWDARREIIYTDDFVRMTTEQEVIMGEGFKANQNFDNYEIEKVTGTLTLKDDA